MVKLERYYLKIGLSINDIDVCSLFFSSNTTTSLLPSTKVPAGMANVLSAFSSQ